MQSAVAFDGAAAGLAFLLGRVLFGAVLAFNGLNHFLNGDQMVGYAQAKGVPAPGLAVPFTGGMLLFGGIGIAVGLLPTLAAGALVVFLLVTTPLMHDFWAAPEGQQQNEMINFLKNVAMLGGALVFLALGAVGSWPYAL
ncbi:DoxX family protein [Haloprofundus salilacus]|uniref:DoxX family protein n=1 Tax=Haloprofundus salilacus TaxID=2876190 RepID=UPI003CCDEE5B